MYEAPKLNCVGEVQETVLGFAAVGGDLDAMMIMGGMPFAEESLPEE
jgi:hypothetical protein